MSYIVFFLLIISGYVCGAPIFEESLQFRLIDCISGNNETLSSYILEITNINQTCIRINQTSSQGNEISFYTLPQTNNGAEIRIKTQNCSIPLPNLHLSLCDDNYNDTYVTFAYENITDINITNNTDNSTYETFLYTGSTVFETLHQFDDDSDEQGTHTTNTSSINRQDSDDSSEDKD